MTLEVGATVRMQDAAIPHGTVVTFDGDTYVREASGWFNDNTHYWPINLHTGQATVVAVGQHTETLAQYQQRFAVTAIWAALENGGSGYLSGAREALSTLDVPDPSYEAVTRLGEWVSGRVNSDHVPMGTVLLSGAGDRAVGHTLYQRTAHGFTHLSGPRTVNPPLMRVVGFPASVEVQQWPVPGGDETAALQDFMRRAWELGYGLKQDRQWCGMFEASMCCLGLSESVVRDFTPASERAAARGARVPDHAALLAAPIGTIIVDNPEENWHGWSARKVEADLWRISNDGPDGSFNPANAWTTTTINVHPGLTFHYVPAQGPTFEWGREVSNEDVASMPPGAVIRWGPPGSTGLMDRAVFARPGEGEPTSGRCRTTSIVVQGNRGSHSGDSYMFVVWDGVSPITESRVFDRTELQQMPVGTVIGQSFNHEGRPSAQWVKNDTDNWVRMGSAGVTNVPSSRFSVDPLRYMYIPVPGVPALQVATPQD